MRRPVVVALDGIAADKAPRSERGHYHCVERVPHCVDDFRASCVVSPGGVARNAEAQQMTAVIIPIGRARELISICLRPVVPAIQCISCSGFGSGIQPVVSPVKAHCQGQGRRAAGITGVSRDRRQVTRGCGSICRLQDLCHFVAIRGVPRNLVSQAQGVHSVVPAGSLVTVGDRIGSRAAHTEWSHSVGHHFVGGAFQRNPIGVARGGPRP